MTKISGKIISLFIPFFATVSSCNNDNAGEGSKKAVLDTISLSNKSFALAYQDGNKIVATSIDTMKQISFGGATEPAISPDGNKLAYTVQDTAGHKSIWVADMENKSQLQLQVNGANHYDAIWSPDGTALAFSIINEKNINKVGLIKTDNTGYTMFDGASSTNFYAPTWKNEKEIVAQDLINLYIFDLTGKVIDKKPIETLIGKQFNIANTNRFFYSKDGQKLIFNAGNSDKLPGLNAQAQAVYVLDLTSKKVERISADGMNVPYVFLTADDRIFYSGSEKPFTQSKIYVSDLKGNSKLVVDKGTNPTGTLK